MKGRKNGLCPRLKGSEFLALDITLLPAILSMSYIRQYVRSGRLEGVAGAAGMSSTGPEAETGPRDEAVPLPKKLPKSSYSSTRSALEASTPQLRTVPSPWTGMSPIHTPQHTTSADHGVTRSQRYPSNTTQNPNIQLPTANTLNSITAQTANICPPIKPYSDDLPSQLPSSTVHMTSSRSIQADQLVSAPPQPAEVALLPDLPGYVFIIYAYLADLSSSMLPPPVPISPMQSHSNHAGPSTPHARSQSPSELR